MLPALDNPPSRDLLRCLAVGRNPQLQQLFDTGDLQLFFALIEESPVCELIYEPRCTHNGDVRDLSKLRRVPEVPSGNRDERLREALPDEDLQHPLVEVGKQVRYMLGQHDVSSHVAGRFRLKSFEAGARKRLESLGVNYPNSDLWCVAFGKLHEMLGH